MTQIRHQFVLVFMVITLLIAAALRFPALETTPPGLHYDEAANAILSAEIGLQGERPIFIAGYTGKEVLFFYLAGGVMRLVGDSVFSLRITAALVGLLTVAGTYWLGAETLRDKRIAMLAAALMAVSFWHLLFSRLGFRAITQPLLQAITIATLLRGLKRGQWGWIIASGVALGLTAYTYLAARLFPVLLLGTAVPLLLNKQRRWERWSQLVLSGAIGLIVLTPLLLYFVQHPDAFWVRIGQVSPDTATLSVWESYWLSLKMFVWQGDPYIRFNLPGMPLFGWLWGALLMIGWLFLWGRWHTHWLDWERSVTILLTLTPFLMILPTALAAGEIVPSNLRAIGLMPFVFYLPAVGVFGLLDWIGQRWVSLRPFPITPTILLLTLAIGLPQTASRYFRQWADMPELYFASDADLADAARFLDTLDTTGKTIYVSALHYQHPTLAFLSEHYEQVKWLPESQALVFPVDTPAIYLFPANSPVSPWMEPYLETAVSLTTAPDINGTPVFTAYRLNSTPALKPTWPTDVNFGNAITLTGYDVSGAISGEMMQLTLYWEVNGRPAANFTPFIHLEDRWDYRWSQVEPFVYPVAQWERGEQIVQHVDLPVPPGTPLGDYRVRIGFFDADDGSRLARFDGNGRYAGDTFVIDAIPVSAGMLPDKLPQPPQSIHAEVLPGLQLVGYEPGPSEISTGEPFGVGLWWQATAPQPDLKIRLSLLKNGEVGGRILSNTVPVHNTLPFPSWQTPQFVIDHQLVSIPDDMEPGDYTVQLRVLNGIDDTVYATELGNVTVNVTERLFAPPDFDLPLAATFGGEISLLGYVLSPIVDNQVQLQLIWQAETVPTTDYTVFVHLLTENGRCDPCVWQQDVMPQQNQYPTSRWVANEVVLDTYNIQLPSDLPSGEYPIELGLYIAESGQRLQVTQANSPPGDVVLLRPLLVE